MGQLVLKLHCMWGGQKDTGLQEYFVRCQFPESIANGLNEAMLVITVESDTGSSDTGSFSLSDIDSTATHAYWNIVKIAMWTPYHFRGPIVELSVEMELV